MISRSPSIVGANRPSPSAARRRSKSRNAREPTLAPGCVRDLGDAMSSGHGFGPLDGGDPTYQHCTTTTTWEPAMEIVSTGTLRAVVCLGAWTMMSLTGYAASAEKKSAAAGMSRTECRRKSEQKYPPHTLAAQVREGIISKCMQTGRVD
jgi:hypothetical protein